MQNKDVGELRKTTFIEICVGSVYDHATEVAKNKLKDKKDVRDGVRIV